MAELVVGRPSSDFLRVSVGERGEGAPDDYWDGNWVRAKIDLRAGGFRGSFGASLRAEELRAFRDAVAGLRSDLEGTARFETMEGQLAIELRGDGRGHFTAECEARDDAGAGNRLLFSLELDQTEIPGILEGLEEIVRAHPVKGEEEG